MATTSALGYASSVHQARSRRAAAVVAAVMAAALVWAVSVSLLGVNLAVRFGSGSVQTVSVGYVIGASLIASLLSWLLLSVLERRTSHARAIWTALAFLVLIASLGLPLSAAVTTSSRVTLIAMHLLVAGVLIPALRSTSPRLPTVSR